MEQGKTRVSWGGLQGPPWWSPTLGPASRLSPISLPLSISFPGTLPSCSSSMEAPTWWMGAGCHFHALSWLISSISRCPPLFFFIPLLVNSISVFQAQSELHFISECLPPDLTPSSSGHNVWEQSQIACIWILALCLIVPYDLRQVPLRFSLDICEMRIIMYLSLKVYCYILKELVPIKFLEPSLVHGLPQWLSW